MDKQCIISISREYGSGGRDIAILISRELDIPIYNRDLIRDIANQMDMKESELRKYDEKARNRLLTRSVGKYTNSMEEILIERQFDWIREKADSGESFVIVGRCAETVLRGHPGLISIFVTGEEEFKIRNIMRYLSVGEEEARAEEIKVDRKRQSYHNRYSDHKWGDSRCYDLVINSAPLGVEGTAAMLIRYIQARKDALQQ
ncbi:MAG: cytidylate kinase-like family protein [Lachnospiraceae bacterium]|nr:cytidylate kinase-like family protein [Lachnospiraceae bacterium]